ncbi:MAG: glycosyltransferase family 39 protein [Magnetococcales bacterium]|nr:glycosyltransferase family 39 protein [Magnetococcales bacterium]
MTPMPAIARITIKAVPPHALWFLLLVVLGNTLRLSHGHIHPTQLPIVTLALFGIGGYFALNGNHNGKPLPLEKWLSGLWLLFASFLILGNQTIHALNNDSHRLLNLGLWVNAILALYLWIGTLRTHPELPDTPKRRLPAYLALALWPLLLWGVLQASPNPNIDVFHHGVEAVNYLLNGKNPYNQPLSDLYHGAYGYVPGYIYLPVILIANTVTWYLFGDIRVTYIIAQLVILTALWRLGRDRNLSPTAATLLPLVWISFPVTLFVLEQAWNDTLLIMFTALLAWSLNRQSQTPKAWITTGIFLGLTLATKQYAAVISWVSFLYLWRRFGPRTAIQVAILAALVFTLTILPFLLQDPQAFINHTFAEIAGYKIRQDALSWIAYILVATQLETPGSQILVIYVLLAGITSLWFITLRHVTLWHWSLASILIYATLFLFGKQAFCNYYHFLAFFILLAIVFAQGGSRLKTDDAPSIPLPTKITPPLAFPQPLFWSLMAIAVLLRLTFLDTIEFKEDEFNAITLTFEQFFLGKPALIGLKSSTGLYNPPFFLYLLALPVFWTTDPKLVTLFIILLNLGGIFLLYRLLKRHVSLPTAAITTLLFTSSPWTILYSRKIWAQDCLMPFMMALCTILLSLSERYRPWKVWTLFLLVALTTQLHMSAWFLPPAILIFLIRYRIAIRGIDLALGLLLFIAVYAPYLYFHQQTHYENLLEAWRLLGTQQGQSLTLGNFFWMFLIASGLGLHYLLGSQGFTLFWDSYVILLPQLFFFIFLLLAALGLIAALSQHWPLRPGHLARSPTETPGQKLVTLLLLFLITIHGGYLLLGIPTLPHYSIIFYPSLFLFAALMMENIHTRMTTHHRQTLSLTLITAMVLANLYVTFAFHAFVLYRHQSISGDYGTPYFVRQQEWQAILPSWKKAAPP